MNWETNSQPQDYYNEPQYSGYTGAQQQQTYEQQSYTQQTGTYQPEQQAQRFSYIVYNQPPHFVVRQSPGLGVVAAILSYAGGWFTGLLFFLFAGQNRYVRFHALQSLIFFGAINILDIALFNLGMFARHHLPFFNLTFIAILALFILNVVGFFGWLIGMIQAARGKYYKLPIVGNFVEHFLKPNVILK